jgi:hypothetical protein
MENPFTVGDKEEFQILKVYFLISGKRVPHSDRAKRRRDGGGAPSG